MAHSGWVKRWCIIGLLVLAACVGRIGARNGVDVLVIAPHPDDEVLLAGGVMDRGSGRAGGWR